MTTKNFRLNDRMEEMWSQTKDIVEQDYGMTKETDCFRVILSAFIKSPVNKLVSGMNMKQKKELVAKWYEKMFKQEVKCPIHNQGSAICLCYNNYAKLEKDIIKKIDEGTMPELE